MSPGKHGEKGQASLNTGRSLKRGVIRNILTESLPFFTLILAIITFEGLKQFHSIFIEG